MEQIENVPSAEGDIKEVEMIEGGDETDDSIELMELKERASKLSEQLRILNASNDNSEVSSMVEINDEENTIIETDIEAVTPTEKSSVNFLTSEALPAMENVPKEKLSSAVPKKQRDFVQLLNKTTMSDSLEEVNKILIGIEQNLASNDMDEDINPNEKSEDVSNTESLDQSGKSSRPKKTISFCLPEIPSALAESIDQDSPSDDKALIDDQSISSEATVSENLSNINEMQCEITDQRKKIELRAKNIEKSLGKISKQKYFSDQQEKKPTKPEERTTTEKQKTPQTGWPTLKQKEVYAYPDYTPSVYRPVNSRGRNFWQMPFRHKLYQEVLHPTAADASDSEDEVEAPPTPPSHDDLDPKIFARTGDVYSYFERRKIDPFFYANPLNYSTRNSLGGKYAKAYVF
eukprot:GFUD01042678.1.p1 GENE.GFUD01042678.1~~GFUD01042678.1.p1  ORF type:complete len:441 (+),score=140.16 GFUD01042678.1:114-1325(+)